MAPTFLFLSLSLSLSLSPPPPSSLSASPLHFPLLLSLSLSLASPTYGRKAVQAQGNGINFHSRLNSQSISLELNTLPPIRKSQSSISPFPRRHSPAIQRQPRQPCLTFWRCMWGNWTGAPTCCSFLQTAQRNITNKHESANNSWQPQMWFPPKHLLRCPTKSTVRLIKIHQEAAKNAHD